MLDFMRVEKGKGGLMTKVIKKLGYRQDFDLNKVKIALKKTAKMRASNDIAKKFEKEKV